MGSGPNGLAAAVPLAKEGVEVTVLEAADEVGGGARTSEAICPACCTTTARPSTPWPSGPPFLNSLGLDRYGLQWRWPEIDCAHPLDGGDAGVLHRSVEETAAGLGVDGRGGGGCSSAVGEVRRARRGHHGAAAARAAHPFAWPASGCHGAARRRLARLFRTERARALFGGVAAHAFRPLSPPADLRDRPGHHHRRPPPRLAGGGRRLAVHHQRAGGAARASSAARSRPASIESASQFPPADVTMFDLAPGAVADILGDRLPAPGRAAYRRFRHGPGAFKVDFAVEGGVPWTNRCPPGRHRPPRRHLRRDRRHRARHPRRADARAAVRARRPAVPGRPGALGGRRPPRVDVRPCPARLHRRRHRGDHRADRAVRPRVPRPHRRAARCAPAPRWRRTTPTTSAATSSPEPRTSAAVLGPRAALNPYGTGVPGMYICSAATPPGPGAHGMCGANAAAKRSPTLSARADQIVGSANQPPARSSSRQDEEDLESRCDS